MSTRHPQVRQGEQRHPLSSVLHQAPEAYFGLAKLALDHPKGCLIVGADTEEILSDSSRTTTFARFVLIRSWVSRTSAPGSVQHWREQSAVSESKTS